MHYELYIDLLFLENFMMDSLLLLVLNRVLKCKSNWQRIFLGGGLGSGMMCLGIVVGIPGVFQLIFFHGIVSSCMLITGLRIRTKAQFIKAYILLYLCAVFMGGMMTAFRPYLRYISLFYGTAVGTAFLYVKCWKLLRKISGKEQVRCEVTLYWNERKMSVMALMDTGNLLCDPVSGDPVSILDHEFYEKFREQQQKEGSVLRDREPKMRYIPYQSISGTGVIKIFRIEKMCVSMDGEKWIGKPLIGISEGTISEKQEYQLILNHDYLNI